jgi:hypothetical protein
MLLNHLFSKMLFPNASNTGNSSNPAQRLLLPSFQASQFNKHQHNANTPGTVQLSLLAHYSHPVLFPKFSTVISLLVDAPTLVFVVNNENSRLQNSRLSLETVLQLKEITLGTQGQSNRYEDFVAVH